MYNCYSTYSHICFSRKIEEEDRARSLRMESEQQLKMRRRMEREERRRQMKLKAKFQTDEEEMAARIAVEERKLLIAQRKLESIRLLDELLERVKVNASIYYPDNINLFLIIHNSFLFYSRLKFETQIYIFRM